MLRHFNITALFAVAISGVTLFTISSQTMAVTSGDCAGDQQKCVDCLNSIPRFTGKACGSCSPFYANDSRYYHCALYKLFDNYCLDDETIPVCKSKVMEGSQSQNAATCEPADATHPYPYCVPI